MAGVSIIILNRVPNDPNDPMENLIATLPLLPDSELIYIIPASVPEIRERSISQTIRRVEYPGGMPDETDRIIGALKANGEYLLYSDTQNIFLPWEISNLFTMLAGNTAVALRSHAPRGREVDNTADLAAMALNGMLGRTNLAAASLLRFPHGLRRDVFHSIEMGELYVPPKFLALCALRGLSVQTFYRVEETDLLTNDENSLIPNYSEAMAQVLIHKGIRGGFTDLGRQRQAWQQHVKVVKRR